MHHSTYGIRFKRPAAEELYARLRVHSFSYSSLIRTIHQISRMALNYLVLASCDFVDSSAEYPPGAL